MSRDIALFDGATRSTAQFVYEYVPRLVLISMLWVIASLPIVTFGIATLSAYTAVASIRERNQIDWRLMRERVLENGRDATLLAPIPLLFFVIAGLYATGIALESAVVAPLIATVAAYIAAYLGLLLIPTFVLLAHGVDAWTALRRARAWLGEHPTLTLGTGFMTVVVFVVCALLTICFPLLFGGVAFSYHTIVVRESGLLDSSIEKKSQSVDGAVA